MIHEPRIPMFNLRLRHPFFGWQTVEAGTLIKCAHAFADWHARCQTLSLSLVMLDPEVPQCWKVVKSHDGSHDYGFKEAA